MEVAQLVQENNEQAFGLATLAEAYGIPINVYQRNHFSVINTSGGRAIKVPYQDHNWDELGAKFFSSTDPKDFVWRNGSKAYGCALYGQHQLDRAYEQGHLYLASNEFECIALWERDIPAVSLPDTATWNEHIITNYLKDERIRKIFVLTEAETVINKIKGSAISYKFLLPQLGASK